MPVSKPVLRLLAPLLVFLTLWSITARAELNGAFVWLGWNPGWNQARWSEELALMRDVGMDIIITGYSVNERIADYPTSLPSLTPSGHSPIEKILTDADAHGMDVYLGLILENAWWSQTDAAYYDGLAQLSMDVAAELYSLYSTHPSLKGFYLPEEIDNCRFTSEPARQTLVQHLLKPVSDYIHTLNPQLIFCEAPFYNPSCQQPADHGQWWIDTLTEAPHFDLVIPQDGIGARPGVITLEIIEDYFTAYKAACDATGRTLWSDLEVFEQVGVLDPPPTIDRIVSQIETEQPLVERIVIWEWGYVTPHHSIRALDFTENYKRYFQGKESLDNVSVGEAYTVSPSPVSPYLDSGGELTDNLAPYSYDAQTGWNSGTSATITIDLGSQQSGLIDFRAWFLKAVGAGVPDPASVSAALSSDGTAFTALGTLSAIVTDDQSMNPWQLTLGSPVSGRYVRFEVQRASGWVLCGELGVYGIQPQLISLGKPYVLSSPPHASYPDAGGELTDDIMSYTWAAQTGWQSPAGILSVTLDLESEFTIQRVEAYFLRSDASAVGLPDAVTAEVSLNDSLYLRFGELNAITTANESVNRYSVSGSGTGRYVRLEIDPGAGWLMLSEIRIYGEPMLSVANWGIY